MGLPATFDSFAQNTWKSLFFVFLSQGLFGKSLDSPAAADADASDTQSVDSGLSRQDSSTGKRDTVCQVSAAHDSFLFHCLPKLTGIELYIVLSMCRSVRCMERVWWCVKVTATDGFIWSVLVWRPYLRADSPAWSVEMVSESEYSFTVTFVAYDSLWPQTLFFFFFRQSPLF